ncbi:MAG: HAMP domain-containing histidine kinase [Bacteroidetes bacterium]|nr:HAMP domain-containing histidine kinase [Bacteroidota bacterium]
MSSISKAKQVKFWVVVNIFTAISIGLIEYYYPKSIISTYSSRSDLFIDNISTYVVCVILVSSGIYYIKSAYRKQNKHLKENTAQLINSNKEKDKLFSIISHDVKAPLNAIKQYLEFLNEGLLTPQEKNYMEGELLKTTTSTQNLLENLLEWSKIQIDGIPISIDYLNLFETLRDTLDYAKSMCAKKKIIFITDINKDLVCFSNSYMIQLVLRNLLNNAIKFTPKEGLIHIGTIIEDKQCKIYIKDNGVGIAEDKKDQIFSLNVKSTAGTENESGTGLGLVLCKEYMDKLGGAITFESEPKLGTTFYVTLPCKELT